LVSGDREWW